MSTKYKISVFGVILVRTQSECGKIWTIITPNTDNFHAVVHKKENFANFETFLPTKFLMTFKEV